MSSMNLQYLRASKTLGTTTFLDTFSVAVGRSVTAHAVDEPGKTAHEVINEKWSRAAMDIQYKDSDPYTGASDEDLASLESILRYV